MNMGGVLCRSDHPLAEAAGTLNTLRQRGVRVAFLTNNASRRRQGLTAHFTRGRAGTALIETVYGLVHVAPEPASGVAGNRDL